MYVFICLYLSVFVFMCLYLSLFVFILSRFVKFWLSCLQNLYKSKSPISRSPQPVNEVGSQVGRQAGREVGMHAYMHTQRQNHIHM